MLSLISQVAAFAPNGVPAFAPAMPASAASMVEKSAAIPFLNKPPALDGTMAGDVGFDPLGFTTTITELGGDLNYVREAELMHGRQAMLATCVPPRHPSRASPRSFPRRIRRRLQRHSGCGAVTCADPHYVDALALTVASPQQFLSLKT